MSNPLWNLHCLERPDEDSDMDMVTYWAADKIAALTLENKKMQSELNKWERPFDQERLDAVKEQASYQDSLAAQRVYITALEHALKHLQVELEDIKEMVKWRESGGIHPETGEMWLTRLMEENAKLLAASWKNEKEIIALIEARTDLQARVGRCVECGTTTCGYCGLHNSKGEWRCEKCHKGERKEVRNEV